MLSTICLTEDAESYHRGTHLTKIRSSRGGAAWLLSKQRSRQNFERVTKLLRTGRAGVLLYRKVWRSFKSAVQTNMETWSRVLPRPIKLRRAHTLDKFYRLDDWGSLSWNASVDDVVPSTVALTEAQRLRSNWLSNVLKPGTYYTVLREDGLEVFLLVERLNTRRPTVATVISAGFSRHAVAASVQFFFLHLAS